MAIPVVKKVQDNENDGKIGPINLEKMSEFE
jgi:hypothetical protein